MRRLVLAFVVLAALLLPHGAVALADPSPSAPASVQLLAQTPWVKGYGEYLFRVTLPSASPADRLQVTVHYQTRTRTDFQSQASGQVYSGYFYRQPVPVSSLPTDPAGGLDVSLPVNQSPPRDDPFGTVQIGESGVFAVQLQLFDASGTPKGSPLTTFIVYALQSASAGEVKPLSAALVIPVASSPVVGPSGGLAGLPGKESNRLAQLGAVLNDDSSVPASLLASPLTLDELGTGSTPAGRAALDQLSASTEGAPLQVLPSTYSPVSLGDLATAVPAEVGPQIATGSQTLQTVFGTAPDAKTWVVNGPLDGATLTALVAHHATQIIVPDGDLSSLPNPSGTTFARSSTLSYAGSTLQVAAADPSLTANFKRGDPPILVANQLLAELAMIQTETPSVTRGVAILPPADWSVSPQFVSTLMAGLKGNPLVSAVTASGLFDALGQPQGTRYLADPSPPQSTTLSSLMEYAGDIGDARTAIRDLGSVFSDQPAQVEALDRQLLMAESSYIIDGERRRVLDSINSATEKVAHAVSLPPATSITLTSTKGQIPITILTAPNLHPKIQLTLKSPRLIFRPFTPRNGTCSVIAEATEICTLSLVTQNTTLNIPVETRSSGVFPLDVYLYPPGTPINTTKQWLAHDQDTVRSTAVSGVAVIVIIVALLALVLWWGRDLRRGRRPKGMVPAPLADPGDTEVTAGDPQVDGFFERPPPDFGNGRGAAMSPSGAGAGPSTTTETYGLQGRETRKE